ncbi:MAG: universal stress protein [Methanosphaera sp.]|uniref:universal stress protein n=1 Tax=Methanosphaera sp. ISO3-F5 TaxID=1452353 RepID=UPI002B2590C1|nr:universal stress protein [Methanosphaera sp. ISO3-F5]MBR0472590.1 universal stress protein [Methanosphaera sp.]WQH63758.1 universal stress protein [Methanosphaera sp. ISO3-F5]
MYKRILLTSDGSKNAEAAIKHALQIASDEKAELVLLHVVDRRHLTNIQKEDYGKYKTVEEYSEKVLNEFEEKVLKVAEIQEQSNVKIRKMALSGKPCDVIIDLCKKENIDMIVISNSGKGAVDRFLLGSVTEKIIREAPVPVFVIPANKE